MLETLIKCVSSGVGRQILNWTRFVNTINLKLEIFKSRFIRSGFVYTNGTNLLINILNGIDIEGYKKIDSDIKRYNLLENYATQIRNKFDPVYSQKSLNGYFVEDRNVPEYILNCQCSSPLLNLPVGKDWEYWQSYKPMRILWHDSKELNMELWRYKIPFTYLTPSRMFYSLDVPLMLMRYIKYCEYCDDHGIKATPEDYIQDHIVYSWFDDLIRIWLTHIVIDMIEFKWDPNKYRSQDIITPVSALIPIYPEIRQIAMSASRKAISVGDVFATMWFSDYNMTSWLNEMKNNLVTPPFNQYIAIEFVMMMPYYRFILDVMKLIGRRDIETPARTILYDLRMHQQRNIGSAIYDGRLRSLINNELADLIKIAKNIVYLG